MRGKRRLRLLRKRLGLLFFGGLGGDLLRTVYRMDSKYIDDEAAFFLLLFTWMMEQSESRAMNDKNYKTWVGVSVAKFFLN
jgi:hypothetical protein